MHGEKKYSVRKILIIQYLIFAAIYCVVDVLLGLCEMEYRTWVQVIALSYLWLFPVIGTGYLMFAWRERKKEERIAARFANGIAQDRAFQWCTGVLLSAYGLGMILLSLFLCVLMIFTVDSEKRMDNGMLEVTRSETLFEESHSYYETVAFFFRKKVSWQEYPDNQYEESRSNNSVVQDAEISENEKQEETGIEKIKHPDKQKQFMEEYQEKKENARYLNVYEGDYPLADAVWLIYEKHYMDNPNSESEAPSFTYNAKGNFYAEVMGKEHSRVLLVYNGMSENGKCQLFVAEEEHYDIDGSQLDNTTLLEFYAVNLEEGQVYEAHKTTWGGAESEEYKKATKE
ncbi:MAG: hypothetical protein J6K48_14390 [Lachnospiraceae bacterium]|nr:hypothetical protein [Lachnospiraceae bacterium]